MKMSSFQGNLRRDHFSFLQEENDLTFVLEAVVVPLIKTHFEGKFAPAGPILHSEITLLSFPVEVEFAPIQIVPPVVPTLVREEPKILQRITLLFVASD